jgi:hypothetical protein
MNEPDFKLTKDEVHTGLWKRLSEHLEDKLNEHRCSNDNELSPESTAKLRGRIASIQYVLSLGVENDLPEPSADHEE